MFSKDYEVIYQKLKESLAECQTDQSTTSDSLLELHNKIILEHKSYQDEVSSLSQALQIETDRVQIETQKLTTLSQWANDWSKKYVQRAFDLDFLAEINVPEPFNPLDIINKSLNAPIENTISDDVDAHLNTEDEPENFNNLTLSARPDHIQQQVAQCQVDLDNFQNELKVRLIFQKRLQDLHQKNLQFVAGLMKPWPAMNSWLAWYRETVKAFRRPQVIEAFTIQKDHINKLNDSDPNERLTLIRDAAPQAHLINVCKMYCDNLNIESGLTYGNGKALLSFFFEALELYPIEARRIYITADLIRQAATAFPLKELSKLLGYYPEENLLSLLQTLDDDRHNALYYATATPQSKYVVNYDRFIAILDFYPITERYSALMRLREDGFRIEGYDYDLDCKLHNMLPRLDYLRFKFDCALFSLETVMELKDPGIIAHVARKDPRIIALVAKLNDLKPSLFNQDKEIHQAAVQCVSYLLEQAEVDFLHDPAYSLFQIIVQKIISICADVARYFSESSYEKLHDYNKTNAQKIYDASNLRFSLFGSKDCNSGIVNDAIIEIQAPGHAL